MNNKKCRLCGIEKDLNSFYRNSKGVYYGRCKACVLELSKTRTAREKQYAYNEKYYKNHPDQRKKDNRTYHLKKRYGINQESYINMKTEQEGKCYLCGKQTNNLVVDHSHKTGKVRKLLCNKCNLSLGYIETNKETVLKMLNYIKIHE